MRIAALIAAGTGVFLLQIFLSRRRDIWPGLVLPALFGFAFVITAGVAGVFAAMESGQPAVNGETIMQINNSAVFAAVMKWFLRFGLPSSALTVLYFICRICRRKKTSE